MSQDMVKLAWAKEEIDERLQQIMKDIHAKCVKFGKRGNKIDYIKGANIAGFARVADAIISQGLI
jgi:glutamate dehydrogenase (NADP+)